MAEQFFPGQPDIGYSGSDQDKPKGLSMGSSEALRAIGETIGGENGFENMPTAVGREFGSQTRDSGLLARVMTLEARMAVGAELYDTFNRNPNSTALGVPTTGTTLAWIQFGDGQTLGISDEAAQLSRDSAVFDSLPDDGTRYALTPAAASADNYTISLAIHPRIGEKIATRARTSFYGRCNAAGTEGVYVDMYGDRCEIGRFTRTGLSITRSKWDDDPARSYSYSSSPELKMVDNRYIVLIDGVTILDVEDVSGFPVDANHRYSMFSVMCWTGILFQKPEFSAGVTAFSVRGANLTAIEAATTAANAAVGAVQGQLDTGLAAVNNRIDSLAGGVTQYTFTTTGTFVKPPGMTRCQVTLVGGAAGGARYRANPVGGGSGGWTKPYELLAADVPASLTVVVGTGGAGATSDNTFGASGTPSKFGTLLEVGAGSCTISGPVPGFGMELYYNGSGGRGGNNDGPATNGGNGPFSVGGAVGGGSGSGAAGSDGASPGTGLVGPGSGGAGGQAKSGAGNGGNGGNGGYPGGGAGAGGNYTTLGTVGNGGNGAPGLVVARCYFN